VRAEDFDAAGDDPGPRGPAAGFALERRASALGERRAGLDVGGLETRQGEAIPNRVRPCAHM
jgi:hypothetical protein